MEEQRKWFPKKMTVLTVLVVAAIVLCQVFRVEFLEWSQIGPDMLNAFSIMGTMLLFLCWLVWSLFFSPFRVLGRLGLTFALILVPGLFFFFFQPQFGGSMNFRGLDYRFSPAGESVVFKAASGKAAMLDATAPYAFAGFLGNDRNSVVPGPEPDSNWSTNPPEILWKRPAGAGWSGVSIASGYLVTMEQRGADELVTCYRLEDGEPVWEYKQTVRHEDTPGLGRHGPRSTPTISHGMVFAQGSTGVLLALQGDTGELAWKVDVCELLKIGQNEKTNSAGFKYTFEKSRLAWGRAASPLIVGDLVVIPGGYGDEHPKAGATLLAFDALSGEPRWKSGEEMIAYGSPSLAELAGTRQILLQAENQAMGFDAETGKVLWKHFREGNSNGDANCAQVTFVDAEHLLLSKGYGLGGELIKIAGEDGEFSATSVWDNRRVLRTKLSNPVVRNGFAWSISDGFLECTDLKDGAQVWKLRGNYGDGQLLLVGDWLLVHSEFGQLQLVRATAESPEKSIQFPTIGGVCWNTIAISNDLVVVRSDTEMACIRLPTRTQPAETGTDR